LADVDLSAFTGTSFNLIGEYYHDPCLGLVKTPFTGVFDGNGHTISNLTYTATEMNCVSLFRVVGDANAIIRDVNIVEPNILSQGEDVLVCSPLVGALYEGTILNCHVEGGQVKGGINVAGLAGQSGGVINNCRSTCKVYGARQVGGLVGYNLSGNISSSSFSGQVESTGSYTGGLSGINSDGTITDCFFTGSTVAIGYAGGLVGYNNDYGEIRNCYAIGTVSSTSAVGGLVGRNSQGEIYDSYAICDVNGTSSAVGGLAGSSWYGRIERCFAECDTNGLGQVGGLCGDIYHTYIVNSYASGSATGQSNIGGLAGNYNTPGLLNCYSTTYVSGDSATGGLVGSGGGGSATNCFWDVESSGQISSNMGTGKTTQQMKQLGTFVSWACDGNWTINEGIDYPRLSWEQKEGVPIVPYYYWGQTGEPNDPIQIFTGQQVLGLGSVPCVWDKHFILLNDVNMQEQGAIIGTAGTSGTPFTGVFDGNNHLISNLYISNTHDSSGLFGHIDSSGAVVKDLTLVSPYIEGGNKSGSLVGHLESGLVSNCHVIDGYVAGDDYVGGLIGDSNEFLEGSTCDAYVIGGSDVGGLIGYSEGKTTRDCSAAGTVTGVGRVGGLVGRDGTGQITSGEIINCISTADVNCGEVRDHSGGHIGGLVGLSYGSIHGSKATGNIKCSHGLCELGGLSGNNSGNITNSLATGSVNGGGLCGGLVGSNTYDGQITSCSASGSVVNFKSSSSVAVGGLVGANSGIISNSSASGNVDGYHYIGGLVGSHSSGEISQCHAEGDVNGTIFTGGLIGYHTETDVSNSYALGDVSGNDRTGGLIGQITNHHGTTNVTDCYAEGNVDGNERVGGLVGFSYMGYEGSIFITRCYARGQVTGNTLVGGLIGLTDDDPGNIISQCYSAGNVYFTSDYGGGLIGENHATVSNCYARGDVIGQATSQYVGGLIGYNYEGVTSYSYAAGNVVGSNNKVGGLVGVRYTGSISKCFWDITTGGIDNGYGTPKTTVQMQLKDTFTNEGWNFTNIWDICEGTNYPKFSWQVPTAGDFGCPDGVDINDLGVLCEEWLLEEIPADVWPEGGDGIVNFFDWAEFANEWQTTVDFEALADFSEQWLKTGVIYCIADIAPEGSGDNIVNMLDFAVLASNWLDED
jgi:hypothetical protein